MADEIINGLIQRQVEAAMAKKQSSDKASRLAAKWLRALKQEPGQTEDYELILDCTDIAELSTICASVLAQDEVKGPRKAKSKRKSR